MLSAADKATKLQTALKLFTTIPSTVVRMDALLARFASDPDATAAINAAFKEVKESQENEKEAAVAKAV